MRGLMLSGSLLRKVPNITLALLSLLRAAVPIFVQYVGSGNNEMSDQRLHLFTALEVAEELTLRDAEMLRRITPEEITNGAWMDDKNVGLCEYNVRLCCERMYHCIIPVLYHR